MSYYDYQWAPYVSVAERRSKAAREMEKMRKKGHPVSPVHIEGRTYSESSTPPANARLNRTRRQFSPPSTPPPPPTSRASARRWPPPAIFLRCTAGGSPMRRPDAASNVSTGGSLTSPFNWTASPQPKNEERLAGQVAHPARIGDLTVDGTRRPGNPGH